MRHIHSARAFSCGAAISVLLLALPQPAAAQRIQIDTKASIELNREVRDALREATDGMSDAIRELSRSLSRDLGRELSQLDRTVSRSLSEGLRDLPNLDRLGAFDGGWAMAQERNWSGRAEDRQTRTAAIGPNGTLELHNLSGDITVTAGTGRDATIEVIRRSRGRTDADARLGLERVTVSQQVTGTRATVRADYPNERQSAYSVSVNMVISAPAGTRLVINSLSGNLKVTGILGELSANTISGDVTLTSVGAVTEAKTASGNVTITGATSDGTLESGSLSGDVTLKQVKARRITASTVSGNVTASDITCESATLNAMAGDASFSGGLAPGGRYELTSHAGDVRFAPTTAVGFTLTASSFGGDISSSLSLQGDGSRSRSHKLTGKVGDGSATVTLQTFSGDITIGTKK